MAYCTETSNAFPAGYLSTLRKQILASPHLAANSLTADFVGSRGFSVVFRRSGLAQVRRRFAFFGPYLDTLLDPACNAFYLNPLVLARASRVNPHIDRSLRAYCSTVETPVLVSVLYLSLPEDLSGGDLVLSHRKKQVGRIKPALNKVVRFQGDLMHQVTEVATQGAGLRISLVCEQYALDDEHLARIPEMVVEGVRKQY